MLRLHAEEAIEVREVLGPTAQDSAIAAYARSEGLWIVTKDVAFATRCRAAILPTLWLRTPQTEDEDLLRDRLVELIQAVEDGAMQLILFRDGSLDVER